MGKKEKKLLDLAMNTLNLKWSTDSDIKSIKDVKSEIEAFKTVIENCLNYIEECNEHIESSNHSIQNLEAILRQVEIEEYKILNPLADDIFFI